MLDQETATIRCHEVALVGPGFICERADRGLLLGDISNLLHENKSGNDHTDSHGGDDAGEYGQQQDEDHQPSVRTRNLRDVTEAAQIDARIGPADRRTHRAEFVYSRRPNCPTQPPIGRATEDEQDRTAR